MSKRSLSLLIEDILESLDKIGCYTEGLTQDSFERDEKTSDAVVRNLEIIGEAAARLPENFTSLHPEIEWAKIKGLRSPVPTDHCLCPESACQIWRCRSCRTGR